MTAPSGAERPMPGLAGRIGVTGANGFVGGWLCRRIAAAGGDAVEVLPLLDRETGGDIRDRDAVMDAVAAARPDAVVHLAAIAAPAQARHAPHEAWQVNVMGTLNVAQALLEQAPDALLVHAGSAEVYGDSFMGAAGPLDEDAALRPRTVYGATKAAADIMVGQMARDGLRSVRFRAFNHTGPGQTPDYVASAFARQIALIERGLSPPVIKVGNLEVERDFLDVRDVVDAYVSAVARRGELEPGCALNLASGRAIAVRALLETLLGLSDAPVEVVVDPARLRRDEVPMVAGDARRAAQLLCWRPEIPLEKTLADVLEHWRQHAVEP